MSDAHSPPPEFSRAVTVTRLGPTRQSWKLVADAAERTALARRFGLLALDRLEAEVGLVRGVDGAVRLDGTIEADLVQSCVVTLEPVAAGVTERFALEFRPGLDEEAAERLAFDHPEADPVEPLEGDSIDIGEAVAQQLSLAIDPYPKAPGAPDALGGTGEAAAPDRPFVPLEALSRRLRQ